MGTSPSPAAARQRRARMSIAHPPRGEHNNDKENATMHGIDRKDGSKKPTSRGLRSRSIGPGGVEALAEASGNRRKVQPLPRSILKPTVPLSPPKPIPQPRSRLRSSLAAPGQTPSGSDNTGADSKPGDVADGGAAGSKIAVKTEDEQEAAAKQRERLEIEKHREERRKSLANRRVSFAPEATLHTWDVVELAEDATSSSEATNSTRRASAMSMAASPYTHHSAGRSALSSPNKHESDGIQVAASPATLQQPRGQVKRRSSGASGSPFEDRQDLSSSPASSIDSDNTHQSFAAGEDDVVDESDTDEDRDVVEAEETITNVDGNDDPTNNTVASDNTASMKFDSSADLDNALREAIHRADTHRLGNTVDLERTNQPKDVINDDAAMDSQQASESEDEEMTMEVTQPLGGILPTSASAERSPTRRAKRMSLKAPKNNNQDIDDSIALDETMELTTAVGKIQTNAPVDGDDAEDDEGMSMEFTTVVGGVKGGSHSTKAELLSSPRNSPHRQDVTDLITGDGDMDITMAQGRILSPVTERTEPSEASSGLNFAAAADALLPENLQATNKAEAKLIMEEEVDHGQLKPTSLFPKEPSVARQSVGSVNQPKRSPSRLNTSTFTPSRSPTRQTTPRKIATPTKQLTPNPQRPTTPSKTPPSKNVSMRKTSPKRLFKESKSASPNKSPAAGLRDGSMSPSKTGPLNSGIVLTPKSRRTSEPFISKPGMGSPRVAAILDRRTSIGDQAAAFNVGELGANRVRFEDPRELAQQIENERTEEARRESGRGILESEVDSQASNETGSLRDMIGGLTPKKNKINGRKSLALGGARGLLGKRPRELDDEEDDDTPKRLRGNNQSPVKNVLLPAPPSKDKTTGRLGRAANLKSLTADTQHTPVIQGTPKNPATTPQGAGRFRNTEVFRSAEKPPASFNEQITGQAPAEDLLQEDEPIHLQDFLNMTSIRFMELTTTKRRHTIAPARNVEQGGDDTISGNSALADPSDDRSLSACVVAGASTIPLLELYQHSCRELKKYISEGRGIVREIENDTFEENPPLFREYLSASTQVRTIMDNQFKNVKTHARLLSKEMWYEWRMKLLDGLKEGLERIQEGLDSDDAVLQRRQQILQAVVPQLSSDYAALEQEVLQLRQQADALADCDPGDLQSARSELIEVDGKTAAVKRQIEELEAQIEGKTTDAARLHDRKATCNADIAKAERVREEYRGWSAAEVISEKEKVDSIEAATGWTLSSAHGSELVLVFKSEVALHLTPAAFRSSTSASLPNAPISLSYAGEAEGCTTTQRFFLQFLRARLLSINQAQSSVRDALNMVERGWKLATAVVEQVDALRACWPTYETILGDETLQISSAVLLRSYETKVEASFDLSISGTGADITTTIQPHAETIYGTELKHEKMADVLASESGLRKDASIVGDWGTAVEMLESKLNKFLASKEKL